MQTIKRIKKGDFTIISNVFLKDKNLSIKAKGFLALVMGLPNDWDFSINGICGIMKEGRSAIYSIIKELKQYGYCEVKQIYKNGRIAEWEYMFFEEPIDIQCDSELLLEKLLLENQEVENQEVEKLQIENRPQLNTNNNKETMNEEKEEETSSSSKRKRISKAFVKPTIEELNEHIKEKGYHFDAESFFAFYESKGWMVGINKMKNWKMACVTWENGRRNKSFSTPLFDSQPIFTDGITNEKGEVWSEQLQKWLK